MKRRLPAKRLIFLAVQVAGLLLFLLLRGMPEACNRWVEQVANPVRQGLSRLCSLVPWCVMEGLYILVGCGLLAFLLSLFLGGRRNGDKVGFLLRQGLTLICCLAAVATAMGLLWGLNYYADGFIAQSGIPCQETDAEDLYRVTAYVTQQLNACADTVPRREDGVYVQEVDDVLARSAGIYENISRTFPCLKGETTAPKGMLFSRIMSRMGFTGVTFPLTGESCLNREEPVCFLPSTVAHELAHQKGFALEQECNFIAVLCCTTCDRPEYRYSGWLLAYSYLSSDLFRADPRRWAELRQTLDERVTADLEANSLFWQSMSGPVETLSHSTYDALLKSYGQQQGILSYDAVTELLVSYYRELAGALPAKD